MYSYLPNVVYLPYDCGLLMGEKLNIAKGRATGDIVVVMDDDDYYPPERVLIAVRALEENPEILVAGCSKTYMYYTDTDEVFCAGPYNDNHALNCTIAFRSSYTGKYDDNEPCAVERAFLNDFTEDMVQLNSKNTILHIIHSTNTFNAIEGRNKGTLGLLRKTHLKLDNFIHDEEMRQAFMGAY
jgi:glycosyltransferase involved in cell wall biosynthesis